MVPNQSVSPIGDIPLGITLAQTRTRRQAFWIPCPLRWPARFTPFPLGIATALLRNIASGRFRGPCGRNRGRWGSVGLIA